VWLALRFETVPKEPCCRIANNCLGCEQYLHKLCVSSGYRNMLYFKSFETVVFAYPVFPFVEKRTSYTTRTSYCLKIFLGL